LCFDGTNFDTFIDSRTTSELAQRGHAKSKRTNLRLVGLALLVSTDFHIPLFSHFYPGNQPDSVTFASVTEELIERATAYWPRILSTLLWSSTRRQFGGEGVGSYPLPRRRLLGSTQHQDLLDVPLDRFQSFEDSRLEGLTAFRTSKKVLGRHWTIVVTHSQELLDGQLRGIAQVLRKRRRALSELQGKLKRSQKPTAKGKGYTLKSLQAHAQHLSSGQYIPKILRVEIRRQRGKTEFPWRTDATLLKKWPRGTTGYPLMDAGMREQWATGWMHNRVRMERHGIDVGLDDQETAKED